MGSTATRTRMREKGMRIRLRGIAGCGGMERRVVRKDREWQRREREGTGSPRSEQGDGGRILKIMAVQVRLLAD